MVSILAATSTEQIAAAYPGAAGLPLHPEHPGRGQARGALLRARAAARPRAPRTRSWRSWAARGAVIPLSDEPLIVQQLVRPQPPKIFQGRSKTMPIVVFLAVMMAAIGLAFLLENVRPRSFDGAADSPAQGEGQADVHDASRRTA